MGASARHAARAPGHCAVSARKGRWSWGWQAGRPLRWLAGLEASAEHAGDAAAWSFRRRPHGTAPAHPLSPCAEAMTQTLDRLIGRSIEVAAKLADFDQTVASDRRARSRRCCRTPRAVARQLFRTRSRRLPAAAAAVQPSHWLPGKHGAPACAPGWPATAVRAAEPVWRGLAGPQAGDRPHCPLVQPCCPCRGLVTPPAGSPPPPLLAGPT